MKKFIYINICLLLVTGLVSCNKFLDVHASNEIQGENLFKDGEGVRMAVNGVYKGMSDVNLYGKNLTWGMISAMGYNYDINSSIGTGEQQAADYNWENASAQQLSENTWKKAYKVISNANKILEEIDSKSSEFFEYGEMEKNLIKGEMIGVRAMLHLDILRLFTPSFVSGATSVTLPYVDLFGYERSAHVSREIFFDKVVQDLLDSRDLLAPIDTIKYQSRWRSNQGRYKQIGNSQPAEGSFFGMRAQRMNYYATTLLLARAFMYKGDLPKAYSYSSEFYDLLVRQRMVAWTSATYQGGVTNVDFVYIKKPDELVLTGHNPKNFENYEAATASSSAYTMKNIDHLFANDKDDYRYVAFYNRYNDKRYLTWARPRGTSTMATSTVAIQGDLVPMIRMSEAYHILIECLLDQGDVENAVARFNALRTNRGAKRKLDVSMSIADLKEELYQDIIKENLTEGQTFYMFKRLNRNIYNGANARIMQAEEWFIPLPLSETTY